MGLRSREAPIQNVILRWLEHQPDVIAWRQNAGMVMVQGNSGRRYPIQLARVGAADITGVLQGGKRIEIEVKAPGGKQNENQLAFQAQLESFGGVYILAYSLDDVIQAFERIRNDRDNREATRD